MPVASGESRSRLLRVAAVLGAGALLMSAAACAGSSDASRSSDSSAASDRKAVESAPPSVYAGESSAPNSMTIEAKVIVTNELPIQVRLSAFTEPYDDEWLPREQWSNSTGSPAHPAPAGFVGTWLQPGESAERVFHMPVGVAAPFPFTLLAYDGHGGNLASIPLKARVVRELRNMGWGIDHGGYSVSCAGESWPLDYRDGTAVARHGSAVVKCLSPHTSIRLTPEPITS